MTIKYQLAQGYYSHAELTPLSALDRTTVNLYFKRNGKPHSNRVRHAILRRIERKSRKPLVYFHFNNDLPVIEFEFTDDMLAWSAYATNQLAAAFGIPPEELDLER